MNHVEAGHKVEKVTDSRQAVRVSDLDGEVYALVSQYEQNGEMLGTILYIPGFDIKTLIEHGTIHEATL